MVIGAFPVAKLGVLAIKQISKPIANALKTKAKNSQFFRQYICMPPAQFYNWVDVKTKMWAMNLGKPVVVPQLNEAMAIELGANLLGETIIFAIGAAVLILEYARQSNKEAAKEENIRQEKKELQVTLRDLQFQAERQDAQIRELSRLLAEVQSRVWLPRKPFSKDKALSESVPNLQTMENRIDAAVSTNNVKTENLTQYDPNCGIVFKALNLIENEILFTEETQPLDQEQGIITRALVYLKY